MSEPAAPQAMSRPALARCARWLWVAYATTAAALVSIVHVVSGIVFADGLALAAVLRPAPALGAAAIACALLPRFRRLARRQLFDPLLAVAGEHDRLAQALTEATLREESLIAGRERAEVALRESEQRLVATTALGEIGTWHYDCETGGLTLDALSRVWLARDDLGPPGDLAGLLTRIPAADAARVTQGLKDHLAGRTACYEAEFGLASAQCGMRRYRARGQGGDVGPDGWPRRVSGILQDVTDAREATAALAAAHDDARRLAREKSAFVANLCHEMRTPLTGVLGMLSLLLRDNPSRDQREFIEVALKSGRALFGLIDNVLDLSRIEARAVALEHVEFDLRTLAEDVVDMLAEQAHRKCVDIVLRCEPGLPRRIAGDPARLRQVLVNLLDNAVRFTERGHVTLELGTDPAGGGVRFAVADTGIGIAPHRHARIFEAFTQAECSTSRRHGGSGLGLGITRQLVGLMGADLRLESEVGAGSRFSFELPLDSIPAGPRDGEAAGALAARRILVQDPSQAVVDACASLLRSHGARVECVADARELRPALQAANPPFDAVIFDAGSDLFASAREIAAVRAVPALRAVKFIACVPFGRRTDAADVRALGADGFLIKPMREARLLRTIGDVLAVPAAAGDEARAAAVPRPATGAERRTLAGLSVLVVDDVITNLKVVAGMLARLGVRAELADSGRAALDAINKMPFPVIFMDCQMPGMDGFEATALIRARHGAGEGPRIIAMTANAASTDRDRCLAHGMDDYLAKPVMLSDLERVLHRWVIGGTTAARSARLTPVITRGAVTETVDRRKLDELAGLLSAAEFGALCARFTDDGQAQLSAFAAGLASGDFAAARQAAHALKGAAANMGAAALAALCRGVEDLPDAGLDGALVPIREAFADFRAQLRPTTTIAA